MISLCTVDVVFLLTDTAVKIFSEVATYYTFRSRKYVQNFFLRQHSKSLIEEAPRTVFKILHNRQVLNAIANYGPSDQQPSLTL